MMLINISVIKRSLLINLISYAFILLFLYTAFNKLFLFEPYIRELRQSPSLSMLAIPLSVIVPGAEIIISVLLFFERTRKWGMYGALSLMTLFTIYVGCVLVFTQERPCQCGGMIRELSWGQHMIFNLFFVTLGVIGVLLMRSENAEKRSMNLAA